MLKQRQNFNVKATLGFLRPFNFQIQSEFNVSSTLRFDIVQRWVNVEMTAGSFQELLIQVDYLNNLANALKFLQRLFSFNKQVLCLLPATEDRSS